MERKIIVSDFFTVYYHLLFNEIKFCNFCLLKRLPLEINIKGINSLNINDLKKTDIYNFFVTQKNKDRILKYTITRGLNKQKISILSKRELHKSIYALFHLIIFNIKTLLLINSKKDLISKSILLNQRLNSNLGKLKKFNKKRIVYICNHRSNGGSERVALDIFGSLRDSEEYSLYNIVFNPNLDEYSNQFLSTFDWSENIGFYFDEVLHPSTLLHYLEIINPVIIVFFGSNLEWIYGILPKIKKISYATKIINIIHNHEIDSKGLELKHVNYIDNFICISNHTAQHLVRLYRNIDSKITIIYNGVDTDFYSPCSTDNKSVLVNRICWIGNYSSVKDPITALLIFKNALHLNSNLELVMAGRILDRSLWKQINHFIEQNKLSKFINCHSSIDSSDVRDIIRNSKILICTSLTEGIPLTILESLSCGIPVISTDVGAISEIVQNNYNGFLVRRDSNMIDCFSERILEIINSKNSSHYAYNAVKSVSLKFSKQISKKRYIEYFKSINL